MDRLIAQIKDEKNKEFSRANDKQYKFTQILELLEEAKKHDIEGVPMYHIDNCHVSFKLSSGVCLHLFGRPNTYEGYWGWLIQLGNEELYRASGVKMAVVFVKAFEAGHRARG